MSEEVQETTEAKEVTISKQQYDEMKAKLEARLQEKESELSKFMTDLESLKEKANTAEEYKSELDKIKQEAEENATRFAQEKAQLELTSELDKALLAAGCIDTKAARAHINLENVKLESGKLAGFDADSFKAEKAYLFPQPTVNAGVPKTGAPDSEDASIRAAFGLKE